MEHLPPRISFKQDPGCIAPLISSIGCLAAVLYTFKVSAGLQCGFLLLLLLWFRNSRVVEETVMLLPTLGVQLETKYFSGKTGYQFIPLQRISAVLINEAVTPMSCYFYLALVLKREDRMTLVFKHLRPPLGTLRQVWSLINEELKAANAT